MLIAAQACHPQRHPQRHLKGYQKGYQKGLALIEVLLSLGLSSVMFLVLFTAQSHSHKVLIYSQQLHQANGLLNQMAKQVWAYPHHYPALINTAFTSDLGCLHGNHCSPVAMTQTWATYWQENLQQQLPDGEFVMMCDGACTHGNSLSIGLIWPQNLAISEAQCERGMACVYLKILL